MVKRSKTLIAMRRKSLQEGGLYAKRRGISGSQKHLTGFLDALGVD
jgi:hypothetical protein